MAFKVGQVTADVTANTGPFNTSMASVRKQGASVAGNVQRSFRRIGATMKKLGTRMTQSLTLPIAGFGAASLKAFADFDQAMTESTAIMDGVTKDVRSEMEGAAKAVSEQLAISSKEAAESYFFLASAGLDAQQSMQALPQVAKFAQAGMFDMATATDLATDAQSALGLTVDDSVKNLENLQRVTDTLVKANTLANASVQQFSESLTNRAAAAMRAANIEIEEGVAVLAAFADQGLKGQRAGEQFSRILRILSQEAAKSTEMFQELGIIDTEGNLNNMADIIEVLTDELGGLSNAAQSARLEQLGFTARVQAAIKPLLGTSDAIREYQEGLERAAGITGEVAENQMQSLTNQTKVLWNTIVNAGQAIGASLVDTFDIKGLVKGFQDSVKSAVDWFNSLSDETRKIAFQVAGLIGVGGPIMIALGTLTAALGAISWPVVLGVAAVGGAVTAITSHWDSIVAYFTSGDGAQLWEAIKTAASEVWGSLKELFSAAGSLIGAFSNEWGGDVVGVITKSVSIIGEAMTKIIDSMSLVINLIRGDWSAAWKSFKDVATSNMETLDEEMFLSMSSMMQSATAMTNFLTGDWATAWEQFKFGYGFDNVYTQFREDQQKNADAVGGSVKQMLSDIQSLNSFLDRDFSASGLGIVSDKVNETVNDISFKDADFGVGSLSSKFTNLSTSVGSASNKLTGVPEKLDMVYRGGNLTAIALEKSGRAANQVSSAAQTAGQALGQMFDQAILHGKNFMGVIKNILKQLGSRIFVQGITALITGGSSLVAGSIGSAIFGGLFHEGGIVGGSGDVPIVAQAGEGVFTKGQMEAMGGLIRNGGGSKMDEGTLQRAFDRALGKHLQKLGNDEIYAMAQKGRRSY